MVRIRFVAITIIFSILLSILSACSTSNSNENQATETNIVVNIPLQQESIDLAVQDELIWFQGGFEWDWHSKKSGASLYFLAVASKYNPKLKTSEGIVVADRIVEHFRNLIAGGKEPGCSGNGLNGQGYNPVMHAIALAKTVPEIWDQLQEQEKEKLILLAKAVLVGASWCYDDDNDFPTGLDQSGNFGKMWNPNYREGGVGAAIAATYILGGAESANKVLVEFNYDECIQELEAAGFTNIVSVFNKTGKEKMEAAVKNEFTYFGYGLDKPFYYVKQLAENTWSKPVKASTDGGEGYILSGKDNLPNIGYIGMGAEFESQDGNGVRSSSVYVCEAWINSIINRSTVQLLGDWGTGKEQSEIEARMYVGTTDLLYKAKHGYRSYAKGEVTGYNYERDLNKFTQFYLLKELWENVINKLDSIPSDYNLVAAVRTDGPELISDAIKGKAIIDGSMDETWQKAGVLNVEKVLSNSNPTSKPATGKVRVMWDDKYLYLYAEITDSKLNKDPSQAEWDCDNLEIFFDEGNEKTEKYDDNDIQCRIDIENVLTCNNKEYLKGVKSAVKQTDTGYIIEAALPLFDGGKVGKIIGFDLMINDDIGNNKSSAAIGWTSSGGKYLSSKKFGELTFVE